MPKPAIVALLAFSLATPISAAHAWWDEGHMQVVYVAYQRLKDGPKDKADQLLRLISAIKNGPPAPLTKRPPNCMPSFMPRPGQMISS